MPIKYLAFIICRHRLQQLKFLVGGELYTLQVAEYMHWQVG